MNIFTGAQHYFSVKKKSGSSKTQTAQTNTVQYSENQPICGHTGFVNYMTLLSHDQF